MISSQQRKLILGIGGGVVALLIVLVLFNTVPKIGKAELDILVAPSEATLTIDGQKVGPGKHYVTPGEHIITVSLPPMEDVTKKVNTNSLKAGEQIFMRPKIDITNEAVKKWFDEHPKAGEELNIQGAKENAVVTQRINKDLPLVKDLPYESSTFIIGYSLNEDSTEISYQVTLLPYLLTNRPGYKEQLLEYKAQAEEWLKNRGVDITKANITYTPDPNAIQ